MLFAISACGRRSGEEVNITIGALSGPSGLSLVKLMHDNATENSEKYLIKNDPELIKAMMIREEVDLALVPFSMAVLLYNNEFDYQLLGVPVWGSLFLVGSDSSIASFEHLKGKTLYTLPPNTTPDIVFRHILSMNSMNPDTELDLKYTFPTPLELASALESGRITMGLVPEPMVSRILKLNPDLSVLFDLTQMWNDLYTKDTPLAQTALVVRRSWAKDHQDLLFKWCEKYSKGIDWTNTHTVEAGELAVEFKIARDPMVISKAIPRCQLNFLYAFEKKEELMRYIEFLHKMNSRIVGNRIPDEDFFYSK